MELLRETNKVKLCGSICERPKFSHESRDVTFFTFPLEVSRLSGNVDRLNIIVRHDILEQIEIEEGSNVFITGELRSFNNKGDTGNKLIITVFAKDIRISDEEECNEVFLTGTICKPPNHRTTPMGRDICDLMVAVNRHYGRSDYLPCISWGVRARLASAWEVGTVVEISGRIQSRNYIKNCDGETLEKTAFEVSITEIEKVDSGAI